MDHKLATVKYAPNEAPLIGKGRWTMPLQILENEKFIEAVVIHGIKLQSNLETLQCENMDRETSNLQRLWKEFKKDISSIVKKMRDTSRYRIETHSKCLQKDLKTIMNHPDLDTNNDLRWNGNLLTNKIGHLESTRARY